jgi:hypothetical protein
MEQRQQVSPLFAGLASQRVGEAGGRLLQSSLGWSRSSSQRYSLAMKIQIRLPWMAILLFRRVLIDGGIMETYWLGKNRFLKADEVPHREQNAVFPAFTMTVKW